MRPSASFPQGHTYKTKVQDGNQDVDVAVVKIQNISITTCSLLLHLFSRIICLHPHISWLSLPGSPSVYCWWPCYFSFKECYVNGIISVCKWGSFYLFIQCSGDSSRLLHCRTGSITDTILGLYGSLCLSIGPTQECTVLWITSLSLRTL